MREDQDDDDGAGQNTTRYPTLPSRAGLQHMKNFAHMARDGQRLMKWSAMATGRELRKVATDLAQDFITFRDDCRDAFIALARCRYFYPNLNKIVMENPAPEACVTVTKTAKSVAGCKYFLYRAQRVCRDAYPHLGIDKGGSAIEEAKRLWYELLLSLINIAQNKTNFIFLDTSHSAALKKSNVLGKIIIPKTKLTIQYILSELEELEREEFFRLKKVLEVKNRHKKKKQVEIDKCIICSGDMHAVLEPSEAQPAAEPPGKKVNIAPSFEALKQSLSKVLTAADDYEKTDATENIKEFKTTASDLRERLELLSIPPPAPPAPPPPPTPPPPQQTRPDTIPDDVDFNLLCDICKEKYANKQVGKCKPETCKQQQKCVHCGENINNLPNEDDLAARKAHKVELQKQLDETLRLVEDYESQGLSNDKIVEFKETASKMKLKLEEPLIPRDLDVNKLCMACRALYEQEFPAEMPSVDTQSNIDDRPSCCQKSESVDMKSNIDDRPSCCKKSESAVTSNTEPKVSDDDPNVLKNLQKAIKAVEIITDDEKSNQKVSLPIISDPDVCQKQQNTKKSVEIMDSKNSNQTVSLPSGKDSPISARSSEQETSNVHLGVFETEEITEIIQVRKPDGSVSEKRRVVTIVRKTEDRTANVSQKSSKGSTSYNNNKNIRFVTITQTRLLNRSIESSITKTPVTDHVTSTCLSSTFDFGFKKYYHKHGDDSETNDTLVSETDDEKMCTCSESTIQSNEEQ